MATAEPTTLRHRSAERVRAAAAWLEAVNPLVLLAPLLRERSSSTLSRAVIHVVYRVAFARPWGAAFWTWYYRGLNKGIRAPWLDEHAAAIHANLREPGRLRSLRVGDQWVEQVGLPYHWGPNGLVPGDSPNDLVGVTTDPNVYIQDKVGTCDIQPGRRPRGPALVAYVAEYRRRAGIGTTHPAGRIDGEEGDAPPTDGRTETEEET